MTAIAELHIEDTVRAETARLLFEKECKFVAGANNIDVLPFSESPEIAFAGRSNVGKSSLLNALTRQTRLARTSQTPGRTQQINFFDLSGKLMLVDLPGYGYARASRSRIKGWNKLIHQYLRGRPNLMRVCLLIDSRHGLKDNDEMLMVELDKAAVIYQIILTKCDKTSAAKRQSIISNLIKTFPQHPAAHTSILETSAAKGDGLIKLRKELAALAVSVKFG